LAYINGQIKEALKTIRQADNMTQKNADAKEEDQHLANEKLVVSHKGGPCLKDLIIRPAI